MANEEESKYTVELTPTSRIYFHEALEYFFNQHSFDRAEEIARELKQSAYSLCTSLNRGLTERRLENRSHHYQFILYQRTKRADIKIIYYVDEKKKMVYVTDFFSTEKDSHQIGRRS